MLDESSAKCPEVRPKVRPLVCPSHVSRGYSDGRTIGPGVLIVTRVPPAARVAKASRLLRRSVLGYLVCVAVFWLFKCCRYSHLNFPTMGASLHTAVPIRPSSQGLRSLATQADAPDRFCCWPFDRIVTTHRPSGCGPNKLLSPPRLDVSLPLPHHHPTRVLTLFRDKATRASWCGFLYFFTPICLWQTTTHPRPQPSP